VPSESKHTVFVDEAKDAAAFNAEEYFDTPAELLARSYNRPRKSDLESKSLVGLAAGGVLKKGVMKKMER
jgi:U3 small nucleolar RNA-associated protein 11